MAGGHYPTEKTPATMLAVFPFAASVGGTLHFRVWPVTSLAVTQQFDSDQEESGHRVIGLTTALNDPELTFSLRPNWVAKSPTHFTVSRHDMR